MDAQDDTVAIQESIDVGQVLPPDSRVFNSPVVVGLMGMSGTARNRTHLNYHGAPTDEGAIRFKTQAYGAKVQDFLLSGQGDGTGIRVCDFTVPPVGSQFSGQVWNRVRCEGWKVGLWLGDNTSGRAADSTTFTGVETWGCETGVRLEAWNSLCLVFNNLQTSNGKIGLDMSQSGSVVINGGGGSGVDVLYEIGAGTNYTITGARTEFCRRLIRAANWSGTTTINVINCETTGQQMLDPPHDGVDVEIFGGNSLVMIGGTLRGCVSYTAREKESPTGYGSITLIGVRTFYPELFRCLVGTKVSYRFQNCALLDVNGFVKKRINMEGQIWD